MIDNRVEGAYGCSWERKDDYTPKVYKWSWRRKNKSFITYAYTLCIGHACPYIGSWLEMLVYEEVVDKTNMYDHACALSFG